jgi:decaprenylphospho-beta-D-erythro-pentofuranosid-2-ulose 2-reductase
MRTVVVFGATSAIAEQACRIWALRGARLFIAARDAAALETIAADLRMRGATDIAFGRFDAAELASLPPIVEQAWAWAGNVSVVLIAYGTLPDQQRCSMDSELARREFAVNGSSVVSLASLVANRLEAQQCGTLAVIGSVAGDRGRASNAVYGSAKASVATFCSALHQRLSHANVDVVLIKPGFVDTPMTAAFPKGLLWASPERVAADIVRAVDRSRYATYSPWFWRWIMLLVRLIPEKIFVRLKF